jgi:hypothetical protein
MIANAPSASTANGAAIPLTRAARAGAEGDNTVLSKKPRFGGALPCADANEASRQIRPGKIFPRAAPYRHIRTYFRHTRHGMRVALASADTCSRGRRIPMQVGDRFHHPWMWQSLQGGSGVGGCSPSQASQAGQSAGGTSAGAGASDAISSQFDSFIQSIIAQFQSDADAQGAAGNTAPSSPTDTTTTATADATSTTSATPTTDTTDGVSGHHHWRHHHHADRADDASGNLSSTDLTTLQNDASDLVNTLFGALNSASGTSASAAPATSAPATATTAATSDMEAPADASSTASASDPAAGTPWQKIAGIFAQDLLNAVQAYASQNSAATTNTSPTVNAVA